MSEQKIISSLALSQLDGVGEILSKNLVAYAGSIEEVFKLSLTQLSKIPGIGLIRAKQISDSRTKAFQTAEKEYAFVQKHKIALLSYGDTDYPSRLLPYDDAPMVLYYKGTAVLNQAKVLTIVGTRNISAYGKDMVKDLVSGFKDYNTMIVSGLAHGVDVQVHKACIEHNIPTVGVLAHGLDRIYPAIHKSIATDMIKNGGLLTDFISGTTPDKENFPKRNRIVAAMSDATLVVEAAKKGGALLTAKLANGYFKDVFAIPGRVGDTYSEGTNWLISTNQAHLVTSAEDILKHLGWTEQQKPKKIQLELIPDLNPEEKSLMTFLHNHGQTHIDQLSFQLKFSTSVMATVLLQLELKGLVKTLPGKLISL